MDRSGDERVEVRCPHCERRWGIRTRSLPATATKARCPGCGREFNVAALGPSTRTEPATPIEPSRSADLHVRVVNAPQVGRRRRWVTGMITVTLFIVAVVGIAVLLLNTRDADQVESVGAPSVDPYGGGTVPSVVVVDESAAQPEGGSDPLQFALSDPSLRLTVLESRRVPEDVRPGVGFVRGHVRNDTDRTIDRFEVTCWLYPGDGSSPIAARSQVIRWLAPDRRARFDAEWHGLDPSRVRTHRVDPTRQVTFAKEPIGTLRLNHTFKVEAEDGAWTGVVSGELINDATVNGNRAVTDIRVVVSLFDDEDRFLADCQSRPIEATPLGPGQVTPFRAAWQGVMGSLIDPERIEVRAVGVLE